MAKRLLMGNEAFAHAALEAGVNVVAGYPGTPSSEVIETVARLYESGKAEDIYVEWSCNEKAALEVAAAASMSGARALFTCKQVGLNVASDALMSLNYVGVRGGLVIFVADDPGPISSQTEQDTRRFAAFAKIPVLDPATPEQGFLMMKEAFELSERYSAPVIVRPTTRIDHASTFFEVKPYTVGRPLPEGEFKRDPSEWVIFPKRSYRAHGDINRRLNSIAYDFTYDTNLNRFNNGFDKISGMPARPLPDLSTELGSSRSSGDDIYDSDYAGERPKLGIVCGGVSRQYALEAIELIEREAEAVGALVPSYRFLQIGTPYPFPGRIARRFLKDLSDVLVFEELDSVIEEELLKVSGVSFLSPNIHGKLTNEANDRGENSTEDTAFRIAAFFDSYSKLDIRVAQSYGVQHIPLMQLVERILGPKALLSYGKELPMRAPVLCAGCPHRGSFYAMKRAVKKLRISREDAIFCGDIGCYTLGNAMPLDACDTCLCMGAGITMAQGFSVTNYDKKSIAFIGDSTFFASGMTGIANAVYNQHDITICILDNSTTAMTGSQPHPGTGVTLMGAQSRPIDIAGVLRALGVTSIVEVDPLDEAAAESACIESLLEEAPTAIIFKSPCVWLSPFGSPAKVHVNACTGCKKCITEIGCPAIGFDPQAQGAKSKDRGQAIIDESQCNGCGLCLQVCPFKAIEILTPEEKALFESARRATVSGSGVPGSVSFAGGSAGAAGAGAASAAGAVTSAGAGVAGGESDDALFPSESAAGEMSMAATAVTEEKQRGLIGSDEDSAEETDEPTEEVAQDMLEIENAFELDSGALNLVDMYGTDSLDKIANAEMPRVSRATSGALYADSFVDATLDVEIPSSEGYVSIPQDDIPEDAIRVGNGMARPVGRKRRVRKNDADQERSASQSRSTRARRVSRRADKEAVSRVEQVKLEDLDENFDGLVGNLIETMSADGFEEYSTAAAAYSAAKDALARGAQATQGAVGQSEGDDASGAVGLVGDDTQSDAGSQHDPSYRYYMKNTSYRRKALAYASGQGSATSASGLIVESAVDTSDRDLSDDSSDREHLTGEIDLTQDDQSVVNASDGESESASSLDDASDQGSNDDAMDVFDALNRSVYIEVDDGEEARIAAEVAKAQRRVAREEAAKRAAQIAKREAEVARREAKREAAKTARLVPDSVGDSKAHADRDALPRDSRGADTPDLQEEQQEPSRPSAVMDRAEREKMRAKYAQYAHYSPTQYASHNEDGTISSESDRSQSGSDKPSVKQSRWGGRG